jgi:hypothetical protein
VVDIAVGREESRSDGKPCPRHCARYKLGETPWSMAAGMSPVLRYRGQYGSHDSTAKLLLSLGAKAFTQDELDARAAAR